MKPLALIIPAEGSATFGDTLVSGDVDGDEKDELIIGDPEYSEEHNEAGAVYIFRGRDFDANVQTLSLSSADWNYTGDTTARRGQSLQLGDYNRDSYLDVLVGEGRGTVEGGGVRTGAIRVFLGRRESLPSTSADYELGGDEAESFFGANFALLGDENGDGRLELVVHAPSDDTYGRNVGRAWYVINSEEKEELQLPFAPAGRALGRSVVIVPDVTGDEKPDLLVGAPGASGRRVGERDLGDGHGEVYIHAGTEDGFDPEPVSVLAGIRAQGGAFGSKIESHRRF